MLVLYLSTKVILLYLRIKFGLVLLPANEVISYGPAKSDHSCKRRSFKVHFLEILQVLSTGLAPSKPYKILIESSPV
jgi:hypothetical protein